MQQPERTLNAENIATITRDFREACAPLGASIEGKSGVELLTALKREKLEAGPYPGVTLFEAANRIMSDLVILHAVAGLLREDSLPFDQYTVDFGNENKNEFDIRASAGGVHLVGEAFNVAPSFFQGKKWQVLKKLRTKGLEADYRLVVFNDDAVREDYSPSVGRGFCYVLVSVETGGIRMKPAPS